MWGTYTVDHFDGQAIPPTGQFVQLSAGPANTCGIREDGTATCWGDDYWGQSTAPPGNFKVLVNGPEHTCGIQSDDSVICWGMDFDGQASAPPGEFRELSIGSMHTCGIRPNDSIVCWGNNDWSQASAPAGAFARVEATYFFSCALRAGDYQLQCWGFGCPNQPGVVCAEEALDPNATPQPPEPFQDIFTNWDTVCGLTSGGQLWCLNVRLPDATFERLVPDHTFRKVEPPGATHFCGITTEETVFCWGAGERGQLGVPVDFR